MKNYSLMPARKFLSNREGIAATEFALLLPVMITVFFGMLELSDLMTMNRRVAVAVNTMADLTAQTGELTHNDVDDLMDGITEIIEPHDTSAIGINLVSVIKVDGDPVVHWSYDESGTEPYTAGSAFNVLSDNTLITDSGSVIVIEFTYPFVPRFAGHFVTAPFTFNRRAIRWPRLTTRVQLCDNSNNCTT
ncbi:MAG: hypothetical protein DHS20C05_25560 [Hyphococcus sp.]|nr:MAG: hypothetical protein DHS20C05_25560 [Marinicaulis sp.]